MLDRVPLRAVRADARKLAHLYRRRVFSREPYPNADFPQIMLDKLTMIWYNNITVYLEQGVSSRITLFYVGGNIF